MNISIFGLGYVGTVSIACLSDAGHKVIGVDVNTVKVNLINNGNSTIVEKDLDNYIRNGFEKGLISATSNAFSAVIETDVGFICVGTPNTDKGHLDISFILNVCKEIGDALKHKNTFFTVVIRSTVNIGTNQNVIDLIETSSGKQHGIDFAVVSNPEFLREGTAIQDYFSPPYTVVGSKSFKGVETIRNLYSFLECPFFEVEVEIAEMIKFLNNSYHALKVAFANEIGRICKELGIDSHKLMDLFVKDRDLNISSKYFRPGFSYGGSCLPKDLKAFSTMAHDLHVETPIISSIERSNNINTTDVLRHIEKLGIKDIGIFGLTFKEGTDDLRYSPSLELAERLKGKGIRLAIYDKFINTSKLIGKNKEYLFDNLPHIDEILCASFDDFILGKEMVILTHRLNEDEVVKIKKMLEIKDIYILDLVRTESLEGLKSYSGISW
jgi:GDP-mannose 6-dehydrogenase